MILYTYGGKDMGKRNRSPELVSYREIGKQLGFSQVYAHRVMGIAMSKIITTIADKHNRTLTPEELRELTTNSEISVTISNIIRVLDARQQQ